MNLIVFSLKFNWRNLLLWIQLTMCRYWFMPWLGVVRQRAFTWTNIDEDSGAMWLHVDIIKWKHFPLYWPFVRGIHRWPVNSPHKGQWCGALMFPLICAWINDWENNRETGDLRPHRARFVVIVVIMPQCLYQTTMQTIHYAFKGNCASRPPDDTTMYWPTPFAETSTLCENVERKSLASLQNEMSVFSSLVALCTFVFTFVHQLQLHTC